MKAKRDKQGQPQLWIESEPELVAIYVTKNIVIESCTCNA